MNYQEALDYLYSFINRKLPREQRYAPPVMPLDRMQALADAIGNPQRAYPIVHITGTKGKGSVGAMSASILQAAGYRVGLYSSPHLQDFRERFKINNLLISEDDLVRLVKDVQPAAESIEDPTWFEVVTALVFEYFRRQQVDIAVIEVGLGGRLDATNIVIPLVSIITSLSFDHTHLLGHTLPEIAREKAGIIKQNIPVVTAPQPPAALEVIQNTASKNHAPLTIVGRDWDYHSLQGDLRFETFQAAPSGKPLVDYQTVLLGKHQVINATVAIAAMQHLRAAGFEISEDAVQVGLQQVNWSGRLEIISQNPMVILDAAHNADSAQWLARTIVERFPQNPCVLVFGAKSDKDIEGMLAALLPLTHQLVITQAVDARAEAPEAIAEIARSQGYSGAIDILPSVPDAMKIATVNAGQQGLIIVTGSVYLVGEVRTEYGLEPGKASYLERNF